MLFVQFSSLFHFFPFCLYFFPGIYLAAGCKEKEIWVEIKLSILDSVKLLAGLFCLLVFVLSFYLYRYIECEAGRLIIGMHRIVVLTIEIEIVIWLMI